MSFEMNDNYISTDVFAADAPVSERATFITRTYLHLLGAIAAFVGIEAWLIQSSVAEPLIGMMMGSQYSWLIVLGLFVGVSWIADMWAQSATSKAMQYMGLALYVVAEAVVFLPLLYIAANFYPQAIPMAAGSTAALVVLLTAVVFITRKDFSFLRPIVLFGGLAAMGAIVVGILFGFTLGPIFTYLMIAFACIAVLYDTSNILHHYRTDQYVGASLALFASVALLFWYILRLFMAMDRN
jgi:FtsH-binding integral membrane protein